MLELECNCKCVTKKGSKKIITENCINLNFLSLLHVACIYSYHFIALVDNAIILLSIIIHCLEVWCRIELRIDLHKLSTAYYRTSNSLWVLKQNLLLKINFVERCTSIHIKLIEFDTLM